MNGCVNCEIGVQSLLAENESVKEKIRFLETIVRDLTVEKDNYKSMMKQLTSSKVCYCDWR